MNILKITVALLILLFALSSSANEEKYYKTTDAMARDYVNKVKRNRHYSILQKKEDSAIKLLTDPENFESEKYYKQLNKT